MDEQLITVETKLGKLRGVKQYNYDGDEFYAFRGVPYAKPPIGELRFRDPEPMEPWLEVRDATLYGPNCPQGDFLTSEVIGDEDCLYLNIYTKSLDSKTKLSVMVWIHGGGFERGHGDDSFYGPDYFMRKDVLLITINYRLGCLGFLNFGDDETTGNQGLKDQVMALKWIRDNIANFDGDPNNVTIFGESAGGASVHYLCLSPLAKGLFHKAICQSGVALNPWAFLSNPQERGYRLCELLGFKEKNSKLAVEFLRGVDVRKLITVQEQMLTKDEKIQFIFSFSPSIDVKSKNPFMPVHPNEAAKNGIEVPLIIGYSNREAIVILLELGRAHGRFNLECTELLHPNATDTMRKLYKLEPDTVKNMYTHNEVITDNNFDKLIDMLGDLYFVEGIHRVIKTQIQKNLAPTYLYQFTYDQEKSVFKMLARTNMSGASHADDVEYLFLMQSFTTMRRQFGIPRKSWYQFAKWCLMILPLMCFVKFGRLGYPKEGTNKYRISEQMVDMWVNFAVTGKPITKPSAFIPINWEEVDDTTDFRCLNICEVLSTEIERNLEAKYTLHQAFET